MHTKSLYFVLTFCWLFLFFVAKGQTQTPTVQVVVNASVPKQSVSVDQIRRIFSMRQTVWANDQLIKVYVLTNQHQTHKNFSTQVLGMFPYQLDRIWNKLVYSGLGEEPIKVNSEQEMLEKISQNPGAIGYVMGQVSANSVHVIDVVKE